MSTPATTPTGTSPGAGSSWSPAPGGSDRVEIAPGDFVLIPMGVVHREGNAGAEPNDGVIVRVGEGPVTVDLDGPEPR